MILFSGIFKPLTSVNDLQTDGFLGGSYNDGSTSSNAYIGYGDVSAECGKFII